MNDSLSLCILRVCPQVKNVFCETKFVYFIYRQFFSASVFCKLLQTDPYGRISIMQFFNYVMRKVWLHQTRIGLSLYDVAGQGYLKESVSPSEKLLFHDL